MKVPFNRVEVYGQDHSPWVQALLLGLYERGIQYELTTAPPLPLFLKSGVLMPAARFDGGAWKLESAVLLEAIGFDRPTAEESLAIEEAWTGVTWRALHPRRFFVAASRIRDPSVSAMRRLARQFSRGFAVVYFFLLLRFVQAIGVRPDPDDFVDQFLYWENRLKDACGEFLGGGLPNSCDLYLFGMVQCHCSIPTPPLAALQNDPRLDRTRAWVGAMHAHFAGYEHCYSGEYFSPAIPPPQSAGVSERAAFWAGTWLTVIFWPVTMPIVALLGLRVRRQQQPA